MARCLYNDLKKAEIIPWFDEEDLLPGQKWEAVIKKQIRESDFFLLLISSHSMGKRGFVQKEQKIAWDVVEELPPTEVFVIPVKIDDCEILDDRFSEIHIERLYPSYEEGFEKILKTIKGKTTKKENKLKTLIQKN